MNKLAIITAAVDVAGGVEQITQQVTTQAKTIMGIIFGAVALICLGYTVAKGVGLLMQHRQGQPTTATPVILGAIGTIVAGLATSGAFLGWFGL